MGWDGAKLSTEVGVVCAVNLTHVQGSLLAFGEAT